MMIGENNDTGNISSGRRDFIATGIGSVTLAAVGTATSAAASAGDTSATSKSPPSDSIAALVFDVFGTVVDWRASIIREGQLLTKRKGYQVDWVKFADAWRAGYRPAMQKVRSGQIPWTNIDGLHRIILNDLLTEFQIQGLTEPEIDQLNRVWHRLMPWPDSVAGLHRLKSRYVISTLSNGNVALLTNMAKNAGLPWDCILSAEVFNHYKPDPEVYAGAASILGLQVNQVMMCAAHGDDLRAAARVGLKTAFIERPLEFGPDKKSDNPADVTADVKASDFLDLAAKLGA
jgi:2-haloacid dehalogenase